MNVHRTPRSGFPRSTPRLSWIGDRADNAAFSIPSDAACYQNTQRQQTCIEICRGGWIGRDKLHQERADCNCRNGAPLTLCLVVLGRHGDRLEFIDVLLGDRPALTPIQNFYQRMLADDPDEALEQAELLLKERSLTAYYDEVALKGLQLAANDAQRGVLGVEKLERIKRSVRSLVNDLDARDDRDHHPVEMEEVQGVASKAERDIPTPAASNAAAPDADNLAPDWRTVSPVLCLAGRGPLDEVASSILAQLLGKHGLGARVESVRVPTKTGWDWGAP